MDSQSEKNAAGYITHEILRYGKCVHVKGIVNHGEYILGMIDLAARMRLITENDAILFRNKNLETKKKFLKECMGMKNPRHEG